MLAPVRQGVTYLKLGEYHTPVSQPRYSYRWPTQILALQFLHPGKFCAFLLEFHSLW